VLDLSYQPDIKAPLILPNFLPVDTCRKISAWAAESNSWEDALPPWHKRSINLESMDIDIRELLLDIYTQVKEQLNCHWCQDKQFYGDIFQIVRWQSGDKLEPPHADAEHLDGSIHPFSYREYAAIIYLNQEYTGGQLYFPNFNLIPELSIGTLAVFPGTLQYLHGVTPIQSGTRYTIAGFFTSQIQYGNQYLI
jgi:hypothetical protein